MRERTIERKERTNVYQMVTDRIIAELEKGRIPWERPWTGVNNKETLFFTESINIRKSRRMGELQTVARFRRSRSKRRKSLICYFLEDNRSR